MSLPKTFIKGFHDEDLVKRMEYRPLGKTGLEVSKVSLGGGTFSGTFYGEIDENESIATIHKAIKSGINYIDTAPFYGEGRSETIIGKGLRGIPRESYYIATKVGRYTRVFETMFDYSAKRTRESVEKSLKLLGLDYVDVIQIHDIEFPETFDTVLNECLPELEKLRDEGKVRFIGVSAYPMEPLKRIIQAVPGRFDVVLCYSRYTLLDQSLKDYLPFFQEQNLAVICAAGHALGLLTQCDPQPWHPASEEIKAVCRKAANICKDANVDLGKLAMYYSMQLTEPSTFLTGMQTRKLLDINLQSYFEGLTKTEEEVLKRLKETVFTKSLNWEGVELEMYRAAMKKLAKK
ncbi:uncharacterized protein LOC129942244 [Eupeodes corollae]|uniref:uncharacterized protein LOC129942244 n=1 Tax=Eupeodes corollae TaxID=290404 RepID=UPI002491282C|nr:uncharacterized protein LOC129942244 [Eupeodes corollae]